MAKRTIPAAFPLISQRDVGSYRIASATLFRRIAQAQNYLWSRAGRVYGNWGYEGNGNRLANGEDHPAIQTTPSGRSGICVASFLVPPNWGASQRFKVQATLQATAVSASISAGIDLQLYEVDGITQAGNPMEALDSFLTGSSSQVLTVSNIPSAPDRPLMCKVFLFSGSLASAGDIVSIQHISSRYNESLDYVNAEPGSDFTARLDLNPGVVGNDEPLHAAALRILVRNTISLWMTRPPELCQMSFDLFGNTASHTEVAKYIVWLAPDVDKISARIQVQATHSGNVYLKVNGTQIATSAVSVGQNTINFASVSHGVTAGAEVTFTVDVDSTAAAADWGTILNGVSIWEDHCDAGLVVPTGYTPIDEDFIGQNQPIEYRDNGTARAGLYYLIQNDTWLAFNRLRWLVGDWKHKALKRFQRLQFDGETPGSYYEPAFDWTPGPIGSDYTGALKNITIRPAASGDDADDGYGAYSNGYGTTDVPADLTLLKWPTSTMTFANTGARLCRLALVTPTLNSSHKTVSGARIVLWMRARRLKPYETPAMARSTCPLTQDPVFRNRGVLYVDYTSTKCITQPMVAADDTVPEWYGPATLDHGGSSQTTFDVYGHLLRQPGGPNQPPGEGWYFELELLSLYLADDPLPQSALDALA